MQKSLQILHRDLLLLLRRHAPPLPPLPPLPPQLAGLVGRRRPPPHVLLLLLLPLLLLLSLLTTLFSGPSYVSHPAVSVRRATHICPLPAAPDAFARALLASAHLVVRARLHARASRLPFSDGHHVFAPTTLLHGPLPLAHLPLRVADHHLVSCPPTGSTAAAAADENDWLLVAGRPALARAGGRNVTRLVPTMLLGVSGSDDAVLALPWAALPKPIAAALRRDPGLGASWWRMAHATDEFAPAAHRVSASRRAGRRARRGRRGGDDDNDWFLSDGVALVAACQDRAESLEAALPTWLAARGLSQIVLVDWGSTKPLADALPAAARADARLTIVRVAGQTEWVLSRAYNLAIRLAAHRTIIKADCDTALAVDFVAAHPRDPVSFYSGDWRRVAAGASNALHSNGVLVAARDDLLALGAFDERITTYGWDDSDLAARLARFRVAHPLRYDRLRHLPHAAALRVRNQRVHSVLRPYNRLSPAVEIQRNRLLATKFNLPPWRATSMHTLWNVKVEDADEGSGKNVRATMLSATAGNEVTPIAALVSESDALDVAKRAIRLILHRYDVPFLPKALSLAFYRQLADKVAMPERYAEVMMVYRGGCIARLLAHGSAKIATSGLSDPSNNPAREFDPPTDKPGQIKPPGSYIGWRLRGVWAAEKAECSCESTSIFDLNDEEILSGLHVNENTKHLLHEDGGKTPSDSVPKLLDSFSDRAVVKSISEEHRKWFGDGNGTAGEVSKSHVLYSKITCDGTGHSDKEEVTALKRAGLRDLKPTRTLLELVSGKLQSVEEIILDSEAFKPEAQRTILGDKLTEKLEQIFKPSEILSMVSVWTGSHHESSSSRLVSRATALIVASHLSKAVRGGHANVSTELHTKVGEVEQTLEPLFKGCHRATPDYFLDYPELSVIAAVLISARICR